MGEPETRATLLPDRWLLLIHQLPAKPAYLRVKIWRRLQALGAVAIKNAVYALPVSAEAQEDFAWLLKEIGEGNGEAIVCEARLIDGLGDGEVRDLFNAARDGDYAEIAEAARALMAALDGDMTAQERASAPAQLAKLRARHAQIVGIDFFGANGRESVDGLLAGLEARVTQDDGQAASTPAAPTGAGDLLGRVWVTRTGVHVDRIACAWLVHRFIDPEASFKFVAAKGYRRQPGELRFDMFEAELTHEGDRCTFEVLLARAGLDGDPALRAIAEIVHDIDLKDGKFGRDEAQGIARLLAGLTMAKRTDGERIERGSAIFDDLYEVFRRKRGARGQSR